MEGPESTVTIRRWDRWEVGSGGKRVEGVDR